MNKYDTRGVYTPGVEKIMTVLVKNGLDCM